MTAAPATSREGELNTNSENETDNRSAVRKADKSPSRAVVAGDALPSEQGNARTAATITAVIGSTEAVMEFLGLSPQHDEHTRGWRWHLYMQDTHKRAEAVREEARKIIAARRAREDAAEAEREALS